MKTRNIISTLVVVLLLSFSVACSDVVNFNDGFDNGLTSYGPPTISKITTAADIQTAITEATVAQMIAIHGDNLAEVQSIFINDVEVNLSTVFAVRGRITLPIPRTLPLAVDNQVRVTTRLGSTSTTLVVDVPELIMDGFYNEFALDGDTTRIVGDFFDVYDITEELATVKMNGTDVTIIEATETSLSIRVPQGTPKNSILTIASPRLGNPIQISFRQVGYPILDMSDIYGVNGAWFDDGDNIGYRYLTDGKNDGDPETLGGKFIRMHGNYGPAVKDWINVLYARFDVTDPDIINNPQNYYMKFEINNNARSPLKPNIKVGRNNNQELNYNWDPAMFNNGLSLNTNGQWKTLKFELLDMFHNDDHNIRDKTNLYLPYANAPDRNHFIIAYRPQEAGDADISFINFRIVKK